MNSKLPDRVHTIRLRRPWEKQFSGSSTAQRIDVPELVSTIDQADIPPGTITSYLRRFNCPTGLGKDTRMHLEIQSWTGQLISVQLNKHELDRLPEPIRVDISDLVQEHNILKIEIASTEQQAQLSGSVNLLIMESLAAQ